MGSSSVIKIVGSPEELISALKSARGGETILLEDGDYGSLKLDSRYAATLKEYSETVTIAALNPGEVTFSRLDIQGASNLKIQGVDVNGVTLVRYNCENVTFENCNLQETHTRAVDGLTFTQNDLGGGRYGLVLQNVTNAVVQNNLLHEAGEDVMRVIGKSSDILIENNYFYDAVSPSRSVHADLLQIYGGSGTSPQDITIRGNLFYDDPSTGKAMAQGIFLCDAQGEGFKNILIEQNLIWVGHFNTVYVQAGEENVDIIDNSLIAQKMNSGAQIRVAYKSAWSNEGVYVDGNIVRNVLNERGEATLGDNHLFGVGLYRYALNDQTDIYQSPAFKGWESFLPVAGSAIDFGSNYGAQERLAALLAGQNDDFGAIRMAFGAEVTKNYAGNGSSWTSYAHDAALELDAATVSLDFNAKVTSGNRGIFSKDSAGLSDGLSVWISDGSLKIRFEDDSGIQTLSRDGITAGEDYSLTVSFGQGHGDAWLDGQYLGRVDTDMDWTDNTDRLTTGAINSLSSANTANRPQFFSVGSVSDVRIYDAALSNAQVQNLNDTRETYLDAVNAKGDWSKVAYYLPEMKEMHRSASAAIVVDNPTALRNDEGTVVMNFNTDANFWITGLLSLNSKTGSDGFDIYISNGDLVVRFGDDDGYERIVRADIGRHIDYRLIVSFEDGKGQAWLNDQFLGSVNTDMDWTTNQEKLVIGAMNSDSAVGTTSKMGFAVDGTMNGVLVLNEGMTASEVNAYIDANPTMII